MKCLYFLIIFTSISSIYKAQEIGFPIIRNYTPKEYDNTSKILCAVQDSRGIMYFGTDGGVMEYDGVLWRYIPNEKQAYLYDLTIDTKGKIYVAAIEEFGYLTTDKHGYTIYQTLTHLLSDKTFKLGIVWFIKLTSKFVYFQTYDATLQYSPLTEKLTVFKADTNGIFLGSFVYNDIYYTRLYKKGLLKIENNELKPALQSEFFKKKNGFRIGIPYNDTTLLIPTYTKGLFLYQPDKDTIPKKFTVSNKDFIEDNVINNASVFQQEYFVLGSLSQGALLLDKQGTVLQQYMESNLLQNNKIYEITVDTSQNFWLGLSNGISKTEHSLDLSYWDKNSGLKNTVSSVIRFNGIVYLATGTNVYFIDKNNQVQEVKNIPLGQNWRFLETKNIKSLFTGTSQGIYEIKGDKAVQIYKGSHASILYQSIKNPYRILSTDYYSFISLINENGKWITEGKWEGIEDDIWGIIEDEKGDLWLGTYNNGVIRVTPDYNNITKPKKVRYYTQKDGFASLKNIVPFKFKNKIIWGTEKGLYIYNSKTDSFEPFCELGEQFCNNSRDIYSLIEMPDGKIWIFPSENKEADIGYLQPNNIGGYDWVYAPFRRIPAMSLNAFYIEPSGIAWIGGTDGIYRYDMSKDNKNYAQKFNCLIRKISIGADSLLYGGNTSPNVHPFENGAGLTPIKYEYNNLSYEFAAPFFDQEEKTLYSYQLVGYDKEWSKWSRETKKEYSKIPEGEYTFRVKARNVYDIESEVDSCRITVLPPWYRTFWAYLLYGIISIAFVWVIVKLNSRRLKAANIQLEEIIKERTQETLMKNEELSQQKEEILTQNEKLVLTNNILQEQKNEIEQQSEKLEKANIELEKLSIVASETDNAVIIMDENFNFEWINQGFNRLYGFLFNNVTSILGQNLLSVSNYQNIKEITDLCKESKKSIKYENMAGTKANKNFWVQTTITPIIDSSGKIKKFVAIDSDITVVKQAEIVINQQNRQLQELNATKDKFFSIIAHDLKTPFNTILGFSELLISNVKNKKFDLEKNLKYSEFIYDSSKMAFSLLENLLTWSRTQTGAIENNPEMVNLKNQVDLNINILKNAALKKKIKLSASVNKQLFALADKEMLLAVLRNLISNAIKFTLPNGEINISAKEENEYLIISISDTGIGIAPENIDKLFKVDENIQSVGTDDERGTGLGLILCKEFVEKNHGKIWVESKIGIGSRFSFTLPKAKE